MSTTFWSDMRAERKHPPERISSEEFLALPTQAPGGYRVHWRELRNGKWFVVYRGMSCGMPYQYCYRPVITLRAEAA
jgi:hypothetical protein